MHTRQKMVYQKEENGSYCVTQEVSGQMTVKHLSVNSLRRKPHDFR